MQPPPPNPRRAIAAILMASVFIALASLLAKIAQRPDYGIGVHAVQVTHGRFLFAAMLVWGAIAWVRPAFEPLMLGLHGMRTAAGFAGVSLMFAAMAAMPMADATAISFLNPVFAMILAIPLLGERVGPVRWSAAGIAFIGALILIRPGGAGFQPAALLALASALFVGFEVTLIKRLSGRQPPLQILGTNNALGLVLSSLAVLFVWQSPGALGWLVLAGVGVAILGAQVCYIAAMRAAEASFVVPFSYSTLIFAALLDFLVFGARPDAQSALGAGVIIGAAILLAWREARASSLADTRSGTSAR